MGRAILLIDRDLGFLFWLGRVLDRAGYEAFPAKSVADGVNLLRELHLTVDLLILNCSLRGASRLITTMRRAQKGLKTICLDGENHLACLSGIDAVCPKPGEIDERSEALWVETVSRVLSEPLMRYLH